MALTQAISELKKLKKKLKQAVNVMKCQERPGARAPIVHNPSTRMEGHGSFMLRVV